MPEFAGVGIHPGDAPDDAPCAGRGDEFVADDALIDRGGGDILIGEATRVRLLLDLGRVMK